MVVGSVCNSKSVDDHRGTNIAELLFGSCKPTATSRLSNGRISEKFPGISTPEN